MHQTDAVRRQIAAEGRDSAFLVQHDRDGTKEGITDADRILTRVFFACFDKDRPQGVNARFSSNSIAMIYRPETLSGTAKDI